MPVPISHSQPPISPASRTRRRSASVRPKAASIGPFLSDLGEKVAPGSFTTLRSGGGPWLMGGSYTRLAHSKSLFPALPHQTGRACLAAINDDVVIAGFRASRIFVDVGLVGVEDHRVPRAELVAVVADAHLHRSAQTHHDFAGSGAVGLGDVTCPGRQPQLVHLD